MSNKTFEFTFEPLEDGVGMPHTEIIKAIDFEHAYKRAQSKITSKGINTYKLVYKQIDKVVCKPKLVIKKKPLVRCVLCGRIAERTHSANPCKLSGECCDECWVGRVIPARQTRALKKYGNLIYANGGKL